MLTRPIALALVIGAASLAEAAPPRSTMQVIPAGRFVPLHGDARSAIAVRAFRLDRDPVTRREYLAFVRENTSWRRSKAAGSPRAGRDYLAGWAADLDAGSATHLDQPVTEVSWHGAAAFCAARGKRLPTQVEWEYAAAAAPRGMSAAAFARQLTAQYALRGPNGRTLAGAAVNRYGVRALHDRVWEWVEDPNPGVGTHRHHHGHEGGHDLSCAGAAIGASDPANYAGFLRAAFRSALTDTTTLSTLGFRCAL